MTCVVGVVHAARVHLGADSLISRGWTEARHSEPKVAQMGDFVMGFTGQLRAWQIVRHVFSPPPIAGDLMTYMVRDFGNALRSALKDAGLLLTVNGIETGITLMVGVRGRLFRLGDDFSVSENPAGYDAIGCGEEFALGALHVASARSPTARLTQALNAASLNSIGVSGPYDFVATPALSRAKGAV